MGKNHGFRLLREETIAELGGTGRLYGHERSGAHLLSVSNSDENKVFGISFRTPPADSTGIAHILEHSVLCGSAKYPVKEPFVELLKGSLQTFLNAFTYPDKTCYPVASQNVRDLYNLADVYLDAVFFPRIDGNIFRQEGWHYELTDPAGPLTRKGVVYNEMKGVYSSPDSLLAEHSQRCLFPDNPYGLDSGGDPETIPTLTHAQFREFHRRYYHPANARIWWYGDDDPEERLRFLDGVLSGFSRIDIDSAVPLQPHRAQTGCTVIPFASAPQEERGHLTRNWLLPEVADPETVLALSILEEALLGTSAAPLRRALIESGLGEDLAGIGLENELRQMYFSVGLKGVKPADFDAVSALLTTTLTGLAEQGLPAAVRDAACNTVLFRLRENNTGSFPRGLSLMLRALTTWLHDGDPFVPLAFEVPLARVLARIREDAGFLPGLIREHLLENRHTREVRLVPDPELEARRAAAEAAALEKILAAMDAPARDCLIAETEQLLALQEAPDSEAALATIPRLAVADLDRENKPVPSALTPAGTGVTLTHPLDTGGITYLDFAFPLDRFTEEELLWMPLLGRALTGMGTARRGHAELASLLGSVTGGVHAAPWAAPAGGPDAAERLILRAKVLAEREGDLEAILRELFFEPSFADGERFLQLVLESRTRLEARLVPSGHQALQHRLTARFHSAHHAEERFAGLSQYLFLKKLEARVRADWDGVRETLDDLRERLLRQNDALLGITANEEAVSTARARFGALLEALPARGGARQPRTTLAAAGTELVVLPTRVNFVGLAADLHRYGHAGHGSALVAAKFLRTSWLWERVRVQGGAYGAFCHYNRKSGALALLSYRDPNCEKTLETFRGAGAFLRTTPLSRDELEKAVIGTIGDMDAHHLPDAKGLASLKRHLSGITDEERQVLREEVLATGEKELRAFGEVLERALAGGEVAVIGDAALRERLPGAAVVEPLG